LFGVIVIEARIGFDAKEDFSFPGKLCRDKVSVLQIPSEGEVGVAILHPPQAIQEGTSDEWSVSKDQHSVLGGNQPTVWRVPIEILAPRTGDFDIAAAGYAGDLLAGSFRIGHVLEHMPADRNIKLAILKREFLGKTLDVFPVRP
jgi:hypothetical protein